MSFKRLPKKQFFFVLIFILNLNQGYGQPKNWKCTDLEGKLKFSVFADSLFALNEDIYCIRLGGETILFNKSPFQPVWREKNAVFKPGNKEKCFLKLNGTIQIFDLLTLKTLQGYLFSKVELWRNQILGKRENDWVFQPGLPTEMVADSIKASDRLLFLYSRRGLICVDSNLNQSYYPVSGEKIEISPYLNKDIIHSIKKIVIKKELDTKLLSNDSIKQSLDNDNIQLKPIENNNLKNDDTVHIIRKITIKIKK